MVSAGEVLSFPLIFARVAGSTFSFGFLSKWALDASSATTCILQLTKFPHSLALKSAGYQRCVWSSPMLSHPIIENAKFGIDRLAQHHMYPHFQEIIQQRPTSEWNQHNIFLGWGFVPCHCCFPCAPSFVFGCSFLSFLLSLNIWFGFVRKN